MKFVCPYCKTALLINSKREYERHLLFQHDAFSDNERIIEAVIKHLIKVQDQVYFLLLRQKNTRSPHNWTLYLEWAKVFSPNHLIVYDAESKLYTTNPKEGLTEMQMKLLLSELDSVSRARRKLQEEDRKLYHKGDKEAYYTEDGTHKCILPSREQVYEANLSEKAHKAFFSSAGNNEKW
ncbi:MAG: hypothetical protein QW478_04655 [Candidatus Micrarchaeaceae archaeon]